MPLIKNPHIFLKKILHIIPSSLVLTYRIFISLKNPKNTQTVAKLGQARLKNLHFKKISERVLKDSHDIKFQLDI